MMKRTAKWGWLSVLLSTGVVAPASFARAAASLPDRAQPSDHPFVAPLFSANMVLQRDQVDAVWGWTQPGAEVSVTVGGRTAKAVAGRDGRWVAKLTPPPAGGPYALTVSGLQKLTLTNVLVGDVWICAGQSNMEFGMGKTENAQQEIALAHHPDIRLFAVGKTTALHPVDTLQGQWAPCSPDTVAQGGWEGFSAVAYFFGRELQQQLHVPIGLIQTAWGGTPAEAWSRFLTAPSYKSPTNRAIGRAWIIACRSPPPPSNPSRACLTMDAADPGLSSGRRSGAAGRVSLGRHRHRTRSAYP